MGVHFNRVDWTVYDLYVNKAIISLQGLPGLIWCDSIYLKFKNGQKWPVATAVRRVVTLGDC